MRPPQAIYDEHAISSENLPLFLTFQKKFALPLKYKFSQSLIHCLFCAVLLTQNL